MKKILVLIFILAFCITSSVIAAPFADYSKAGSFYFMDNGKETISIATGNPADAKNLGLHVSYATDMIRRDKNSYVEYDEYNDKDCPRIIFTTNTVLKDFKFIEIGWYEDTGGNIKFYEKTVLYSLKELSPEKAFVTAWMEQGSIPHRGVSFVDKNNTIKKFSIQMSGEDGSIYLTEISPGAPPKNA